MRYILGVIGVVILAIVAIILIARHNPSSPSQKSGGKKTASVLDHNNDTSEVRWTMQGPLVGEDQRRAVRVTISEDQRKIEILDGYEETTERSQTYSNSQAAYDTFLHALDLAGFSKTRKVTITDSRGVCPLGNRFIYELNDGSEEPVNSWSASCATNLGPFAGDPLLTRQLFQNQIPDYTKQIQGVRLFLF